MSNILYAGIDVSSKDNVVYIMLPDGTKHSNFKVKNSLDGAMFIAKATIDCLKDKELNEVYFGLEATSIYGKNLIYFLNDDESLKPYPHKVFELNPLQVSNFKASYPDLQKNDYIDSFVIADCLRFGRINRIAYTSDYKYDALKQLTRTRQSLIETFAKEQVLFQNHLFLKYSSFAQTKVFSDTFGNTAMNIYERFDSVDDLALMDLHDLTSYINVLGKHHFKDPEALTNAINIAAKTSYRLPKSINDANNHVLSVYICNMKALQTQIKTIEKQIEKLIEIIPNTLRSIKGIGPVYQAGIIAEIGDINKFKDQAALAKYAGLAWSEYQSGDFKAETTRSIRSGNKHLKYYLTQAALSLVRCDNEFKRYYQLKCNQVNRGNHKRALALTARKFVRVVFHLLKNNQIYIPRK